MSFTERCHHWKTAILHRKSSLVVAVATELILSAVPFHRPDGPRVDWRRGSTGLRQNSARLAGLAAAAEEEEEQLQDLGCVVTVAAGAVGTPPPIPSPSSAPGSSRRKSSTPGFSPTCPMRPMESSAQGRSTSVTSKTSCPMPSGPPGHFHPSRECGRAPKNHHHSHQWRVATPPLPTMAPVRSAAMTPVPRPAAGRALTAPSPTPAWRIAAVAAAGGPPHLTSARR